MISTRQWINLLTTAFLLVLPTGSVAAALTTSFSSCPATLTLTEYSPENPSDFPRQQQSPTETDMNKDPHALSASCPGLILSTTTLFGTSTPSSPDSVAGTAGPASTDHTARLPDLVSNGYEVHGVGVKLIIYFCVFDIFDIFEFFCFFDFFPCLFPCAHRRAGGR
ncbi:hypothetical protein KC316_g12054 [Hortaea werneckii]|nr:hypothetical protein KC316_g12054 [Hortaea werneckii]